MRLGLVIFLLVAVAIGAGVMGFNIGFDAQSRSLAPSNEQAGVDVLSALAHYRAVEAANTPKLEWEAALQLLQRINAYERAFGIPTGSNKFTQRFCEARVIAHQMESRLAARSLESQPLIPSRRGSGGAPASEDAQKR